MLAFACAFTMFAGAASFTDEADISENNRDAVELLTTLKIIKGYEDGSFDPEGTVDRAEMAKMIYTIRNGGNDDASAHVGNTTSFTDISGHWAEGYIKYLQNTGIVAGKSATKFDPDSQVTTVEAMKMALALTGYDEKNAGLTGIDWEKNTLSYATTIGLTDDVASAMRSGCARQDAAQILANCLGATAVRYSAVVENFVNDSKEGLSFGGDPISVGYKWMDLCTNIGTLVGIDGDKLTITMTQSDAADSDIDTIRNFIDLDTDYSDLLGQKVKVLFNDGKNNEVIGVYATVDNTVYTVEANDTSKDEEKVAFGGASYRLDDEGAIRTYVDGDATERWTTLDELDHNTLNPNMYTFVDTDDNGRLDTLVVRTYDVAKVSYVASDRVIAGGHTYKYDDEIIADGIEKDDWVTITHDMFNDCWSVAPVEVQTADLDAMRNDKDGNMYFDGWTNYDAVDNYDEYQIGDNWYAGGQDAVQSNRSENDLKNVKAVQSVDYVAVNGIMFYIERSSGENTGRVDNVAVVLAKSDHSALADQARIGFFNGDTAVVDIDSDGIDPAVGGVYEYNVIGGEYRFSDLKTGIEGRAADWRDYEEYYGDLSYRGDMDVSNVATDADNRGIDDLNAGQFDGMNIDDNAQVVLYWTTGGNNPDWDIVSITGKQFKNIADVTELDGYEGVITNVPAYSFSGDMGGLNRIGAIALQVDATTNLDEIGIPTWNHYGYIVTGAKWVKNLNNVAEYTLLVDDRLYTVYEEINNLDRRPEDGVIGFDELTSNTDGTATLSRAVVETTAEGTYSIDGAVLLNGVNGDLKFTAITDVNNAGDTVIFAEGGEMDISDATIIYVDSKANNGLTEGSVAPALKDNNGDWLANALYIGKDGNVELLVVDQAQYLESSVYKNLIAPGTKTVYGADAYWGTGEVEDENEGTVDGDFTYISSDDELISVANATIATINGTREVRFTINVADGMDAAKTTFDCEIWVNGVSLGKMNDVAANKTNYTTSKAGVEDGDKIVIEISDIKTNGVAEDATADQINTVLENASDSVKLDTIPAGTINIPEGQRVNAKDANIDADAVINVGTNATINLSGATVEAGAQINIAKDAGEIWLPNGKQITIASAFEANCTITMTANDENGIDISIPNKGEVTLKTALKIGAKDELIIGRNAVLKGDNSASIVVEANDTVTTDGTAFYNTSGEKLDEVTTGTYKWDDTLNGWKAQA